MPGVDEIRSPLDRDKLTIAEVCADLGISRRTFYEWRMKNTAPKCITLPNGTLRIRGPSTSGGWPLARPPDERQHDL